MRFWLSGLLLLLVAGCKQAVSSFTHDSTKVNTSVANHAAADSLILPFSTEMNLQMQQVIGYSDSSLLAFSPESPLGNFSADAVFESGLLYAKENGICSDLNRIFCLLNFGGLRTSINKGDITLGDVYELMPFFNSITIVELNAERVNDIAQYFKSSKPQPVSNAQFILNQDFPLIKIGSATLDESKSVFVITSDYLAGGGDKMTFFADPIRRYDTGLLIRDVLIQYIQSKGKLPYYPVEGRIQISKE